MDLDTPAVTRTQTGASNSAPVARKRMSMNFSLPVAVSNGSPLGRKSSTTTPLMSAKSPRMNTGESPEMFFRDLKIEDHRDLVADSARRRDRSLSSASNGHFAHHPHQHQQLHHHTKNNSSTSSTSTNNSGGIFTSSFSHSSVSNYNHGPGLPNTGAANKPSFDNYLSELAAKERKVVELKDELKRMQEALKMAERDLKNFRDSAVSALGPPVKSSGSSHYTLQAGEPHGRSDSIDNKPSQEEQDQEVKEEPQTVLQENVIPSDPSQPIKTLNMSLYDRGASQLPPTGDVLNMGKRVVEELGTQFWGFFDDIKNAAIGDDVRDHPHRRPASANAKNRDRMSFQSPSEEAEDITVTTQPPARELQDLTGRRASSRSRRKGSLNGEENGPMNSYYML